MASLVAKKKGNKLYYYVVESARVDGRPRIVHQAYLGTAEKVADLVKDRTAPVPISAASREFGLPGSLWLAAQQTGLFAVLEALFRSDKFERNVESMETSAHFATSSSGVEGVTTRSMIGFPYFDSPIWKYGLTVDASTKFPAA